MKIVLLVTLLIISASTWADNKIGLGISIGSPTGLNGKYWLDEKHAVDGGAAWSLDGKNSFNFHSDYLIHNFSAFYLNDVHALDLYYGLGGRMKFADDIQLGVRVPVGVVHRLESEQADVFAEVAPIVDLIEKTAFDLHVLFGGRYYF